MSNVGVSPHNLHLLQADVLLPSQHDHSVSLTGPQALIEAMIEDALVSLGKYQRPIIAQEAYDWFLSDSEALFSFLFCCIHLHLDPAPFRRHAKQVFVKHTPVHRMSTRPLIVAYSNVRFDRSRRLGSPQWIATVQVRTGPEFKTTLKTINLKQWYRTKGEAKHAARAYIESGAWKEHTQLQEAA